MPNKTQIKKRKQDVERCLRNISKNLPKLSFKKWEVIRTGFDNASLEGKDIKTKRVHIHRNRNKNITNRQTFKKTGGTLGD